MRGGAVVTIRAPLALFVFKRPEHTRIVLQALSRCPELPDTPLYIFADGARGAADHADVAATRRLIAEFDHPRKQMSLASENRGLAGSIIAGVTALCREHGRVIVLEDDLIVSPLFLSYMQRALDAYAGADRVHAVNAFSFGDLTGTIGDRAYFLPYTHPWGWATWRRAWEGFDPDAPYLDRITATPARRRAFNLDGADDYAHMLKRQNHGELDSWWIRWYASVFMGDAVALFPPAPLVRSIGADNSATHAQVSERLLRSHKAPLAQRLPDLPGSIQVDRAAFRAFRSAMQPLLRRTLRLLGQAKHSLQRT